jgi:hypothetical protein
MIIYQDIDSSPAPATRTPVNTGVFSFIGNIFEIF